MNDRRLLISNGLSVVGIVLMALIFFAPIWWVSLTAPNYPPEAFPDGVRIHFHSNGVFNGCQKVTKTEILERVLQQARDRYGDLERPLCCEEQYALEGARLIRRD